MLYHANTNSMLAATPFCALGLMAKAPFAGDVKTRLVPPLTAPEAAALSICFLRDMTANIESISETEAISGLVVYTPPGSESAFAGVVPRGFTLLAQRGASLGERLCNATDDLLRKGYGAVCLINSDSPTLPKSILIRAIELLAADGDCVLLGAAEDGATSGVERQRQWVAKGRGPERTVNRAGSFRCQGIRQRSTMARRDGSSSSSLTGRRASISVWTSPRRGSASRWSPDVERQSGSGFHGRVAVCHRSRHGGGGQRRDHAVRAGRRPWRHRRVGPPRQGSGPDPEHARGREAGPAARRHRRLTIPGACPS